MGLTVILFKYLKNGHRFLYDGIYACFMFCSIHTIPS